MIKEELEARYLVVEKLTKLFKAERMVYLIITCISLIILFIDIAFILIKKQEVGEVELSVMFGSSGLITYTANRLVKMWNQALLIIIAGKKEDEN